MVGYNVDEIKTYNYKDDVSEDFEKFIDNADYEFVAVVTDLDLATCIFDELVKKDGTVIERADFDGDDDGEYIVTYEYRTGCIAVQPIETCKHLEDIDLVLIDMDGVVSHKTIEDFVNIGAEVILFGEKDDIIERTKAKNERVYKGFEEDDGLHGFTTTFINDDDIATLSYYSSNPITDDFVDEVIKKFVSLR